MRKRVPLVWSATERWHVNLPTARMIPGTVRPLVAGKIDGDGVLRVLDPATQKMTDQDPAAVLRDHAPSVEVELPRYTPCSGGQLDRSRMREMYPGHCGEGWTPPPLRAP